jgi:hypothetical protein
MKRMAMKKAVRLTSKKMNAEFVQRRERLGIFEFLTRWDYTRSWMTTCDW